MPKRQLAIKRELHRATSTATNIPLIHFQAPALAIDASIAAIATMATALLLCV